MSVGRGREGGKERGQSGIADRMFFHACIAGLLVQIDSLQPYIFPRWWFRCSFVPNAFFFLKKMRFFSLLCICAHVYVQYKVQVANSSSYPSPSTQPLIDDLCHHHDDDDDEDDEKEEDSSIHPSGGRRRRR